MLPAENQTLERAFQNDGGRSGWRRPLADGHITALKHASGEQLTRTAGCRSLSYSIISEEPGTMCVLSVTYNRPRRPSRFG